MIKKIRKILNNERGFTLIELMVVVVILGILASVAIPKFANQKDKALEVKTQVDIRIIQNAVDLYFLDYNVYPSNTGVLVNDGYFKDNPLQNNGSNYGINSSNGKVSQ